MLTCPFEMDIGSGTRRKRVELLDNAELLDDLLVDTTGGEMAALLTS